MKHQGDGLCTKRGLLSNGKLHQMEYRHQQLAEGKEAFNLRVSA